MDDIEELYNKSIQRCTVCRDGTNISPFSPCTTEFCDNVYTREFRKTKLERERAIIADWNTTPSTQTVISYDDALQASLPVTVSFKRTHDAVHIETQECDRKRLKVLEEKRMAIDAKVKQTGVPHVIQRPSSIPKSKQANLLIQKSNLMDQFFIKPK